MKAVFAALIFTLSFQFAHAQPNNLCEGLLSDLPIEFIHRVKMSERAYQQDLVQTKGAQNIVTTTNANISMLESQMTWIERKLWSFLAKLLGGDPRKLEEHKSLSDALKKYKADLTREKGEDKAADLAVINVIEAFLKSHDDQFAMLRAEERRLNDLLCDADSCLSTISNALDNVETAQWRQSSHNWQHMASNKQNDQHGKGYNWEAHWRAQAINDARSSSRDAQRVAQRLAERVARHYDERSVNMTGYFADGGLDFLIDMSMFIPGMDNMFSDMMISRGLEDMESDLRDLRGRVKELRGQVYRDQKQLADKLSEVICRTRNICINFDDKELRELN